MFVEQILDLQTDDRFIRLTIGHMHCLASVIVNDAMVTGRKSNIFGYISKGDSV